MIRGNISSYSDNSEWSINKDFPDDINMACNLDGGFIRMGFIDEGRVYSITLPPGVTNKIIDFVCRSLEHDYMLNKYGSNE